MIKFLGKIFHFFARIILPVKDDTNLEELLRIARRLETVLERESEKTRYPTNVYNQSLKCLVYATEIVRLVQFGEKIGVVSVDKALLRCLIDVYVKIAYMMKHKNCERYEQEKIFESMEKSYLKRKKKEIERCIEKLEEIVFDNENQRNELKGNLQKECRKINQKLEEYDKGGIKGSLDINTMAYEIFTPTDVGASEAILAKYAKCHPYVHAYTRYLGENLNFEYADVYNFYACILLVMAEYLPEKDKNTIAEVLRK